MSFFLVKSLFCIKFGLIFANFANNTAITGTFNVSNSNLAKVDGNYE